ncbi:hypothetical protein ACVBGC_16775 [Burkholderia stagnalis]
MSRFLYAGYLAFALYLLYPLVHETVTASTGCVLDALPGTAAGPSKRSASAADGHRNVCGSGTRIGTATVRGGDLH